jgi:hypothetical protein
MEIRKFSSKLGVIVLSIVLLTGISLVPTLQIGVEGRGQPHRLTTPTTSPTPTTPPTSTATTSFTTPQPPRSAPPVTTTTITTPPPPVTTTTTTARITPAPTDTVTPTPTTDAADGAANQSGMVTIPLSTIQMIMSQVQDAMTAVNSENKTGAMTTLNSVDQELKSAVDATGVSVEATTNVDDGGGSGDNK